MDKSRRKELVREYTERKQVPGIFAVRAPDQVWTSTTRNLATAPNGIWFVLRHGSHTNRALQAAWNAQGEAAFAFEVLEEVTGDDPGMVGLLLKEREAQWRAELGAAKLQG